MTTLQELNQYTFYTSVLGNYDYMWQDDAVLVSPSALITQFSAPGTLSLLFPGQYDFSLPLTFPSNSTPTINT